MPVRRFSTFHETGTPIHQPTIALRLPCTGYCCVNNTGIFFVKEIDTNIEYVSFQKDGHFHALKFFTELQFSKSQSLPFFNENKENN